MNASETPLEALAFSYWSLGFLMAVNSVWTWIAVVTTAVVSVWRVRTSSHFMPKSLNEPRFPSSLILVSTPVERVAAEQPRSVSSTSASVYNPMTAASTTVFERTTRKFTLYYEEDENHYEDIVNDAVKKSDNNNNMELFPVGGNWDPIMKLRMENMGLYSYQDLTVLDGSIVRLWEGCRRRKTTELVMFGGGGVVTW